jgi:hypothetical protein
MACWRAGDWQPRKGPVPGLRGLRGPARHCPSVAGHCPGIDLRKEQIGELVRAAATAGLVNHPKEKSPDR